MVKNFVLYTQHDDREDIGNCWCTEEKTDYGGKYKNFFEDPDTVAKGIADATPVMDLPELTAQKAKGGTAE